MPDTSKNKAPIVEFTELPLKVTEVQQNKHAFQMSAPDDYFEIDDDEDDIHVNGHVSLPLEENNKPETSAAGIIKTPTLLEVSKTSQLVEYNKPMFPESVTSTPSPKTDLGYLGGSVSEQGLGFKIPVLSPSVTTTQTSVLTNSTSQMEKNAPMQVSPFPFSANELSESKPNAGSDPKEFVPVSTFNSVANNDHVDVSVSNKNENGNQSGNDQKSTNMFGKLESLSLDTTPASNPPTFPSFGSAASTTPSTSVAEAGNASSSSPFAITTFATTTTTESGLFGFSSPAAATSTTTAGSGLFGFSSPAAATSTTTTGTGLFGLSTSTAPSTSFGASSTPVSSFGTAGASNPSFGGSPSVFGNSTPVFGAVAATTPVSPFGQAPASTPGFMFGSATPTPTPSLTPAPISFSFGGQPNQALPPQNPFQSSSVDFNAGGGSFYLGSGGEKSNRRIVRVMKSKNRKK
ncbi:hypothetical protein M8C21_004013 [Ambrosia artemisiifolia]|uniref:Uncharacterized protein n=1 Tax=Ambrosia artemisiifolia TaxID=4212 RepID=A0AAD5DER3_AMBAR|nr:hypothetical protein M8C21_004013 [Ambrosia artemisiifolia]